MFIDFSLDMAKLVCYNNFKTQNIKIEAIQLDFLS